jgi:2'-5' RNA ligase
VRARLAAEGERLRPLAPDVAWVTRDNLHLTLKFLGGVEPARLETLAGALAASLAGRPAFAMTIRGLGAFPSRTQPRVLWAGVDDGAATLAALATSVDDALESLDFPRESRRFSAHVTLGRVRQPRPNPRLARALAVESAFGGQLVARVSLMRSELSPRGPRYTELTGVPLDAGQAARSGPGSPG